VALMNSAKGTIVVLAVMMAGAGLAGCGSQHVARGGSATPVARIPSAAPSPTPSGASSGPSPQRPAPTRRQGSAAPPDRAGSAAPASPPAPSTSSRAPDDGVPARRPTAATSRAIDHSVEAGGRSVALTFDDGPDPRWTPEILALLSRHHAEATFCEIGPNAQAHPDLVKRIIAAGYRLCDHSVHHDERQSSKSLDYNRHEIVDAQREITAAAGPGSRLLYYRAPGGDFSPAIRGLAAARGLRPLGWTADSEDWKRPGVPAILSNIGLGLKPGSIVLMHDGGGDRSQTVEALAELLDQLDAEGYRYTFPEP